MSDTVLPLVRRKQRWIIIAFFFFSGILAATWTSRIPDIQHKLALSNAALGTVLFSIPVGLVAGLSVASWLVATFGAKKVMISSCVCGAAALALAGFSSSQFLLMPALFFFGVCRTVLNLSSNAGAIDVQQLYDRPIISGFHGVWSTACFLAAGISTGLIVLDVKPVFHFLSVAVFNAAVALLF
jgi:MFS family permease